MRKKNFQEIIKKLQKRIGYTFGDAELLEVSLTHPSISNEDKQLRENNQRMEFLGDAVLGLVLADELYECYPEEREGFLGQSRSSLVRGKSLAKIARKLRIQEAILFSTAEERSGGRKKDSNLEDALESLVGAIFLDSDYPTVKRIILKWLGNYQRNLEKRVATDNPKGNLQEAVQATGEHGIEYEILQAKGPDHLKKFKVAVYINGKRSGIGTGNSKKKAEEMAAEKALRRFK
tara:strand:+ start:70 stop:771 length:702 start_codon:yes stop_codon:yes gene_type:complete